MKHVHHYLNEFMNSQKMKQGLNLGRLLERWEELLGHMLSSRITPISYEKGILICKVSSSGLIQELSFLQTDILNKLRQIDEGKHIKGIRFVSSDTLRKQDPVDLDKIEQAGKTHLKNYDLNQSVLVPELTRQQIEMDTSGMRDEFLRNKTKDLLLAIARRQQQLKVKHWKTCHQCQSFFEPEYLECPFCTWSKNIQGNLSTD